MKKKIFQLVLLFFLSVIWLFPFQLQRQEWIMLIGAFAAFLCLLLIPQRIAAFAAAAAVVIGFSLYKRIFFAAFAPGLAACAVYFAAVRAKAGVPFKKDAFLQVDFAAAAVCTAGSLLYVFAALKHIPFAPGTFDRHVLFSLLAAAAAAAALFAVVRRQKKPAAVGKKQAAVPSADRLVWAYAAMLASFAASGVLLLKQLADPSWNLLPVFLCVFTVLTVPEPVKDALFIQEEQ